MVYLDGSVDLDEFKKQGFNPGNLRFSLLPSGLQLHPYSRCIPNFEKWNPTPTHTSYITNVRILSFLSQIITKNVNLHHHKIISCFSIRLVWK